MKIKLLVFLLFVSVLFSVFAISSFAADEPIDNEQIIIPAGTYRFNDTPTFPSDETLYEVTINYSLPNIDIDEVEVYGNGFTIYSGEGVGAIISSFTTSADPNSNGVIVYSTDSDDGWNIANTQYSFFPLGFGQVITILEDTSVSPNFYSWFSSNSSLDIDTGVLLAGSYESTGDALDISAFNWIDSGDTVYFNANGYVIQGFNQGTRFDQIGIIYIETSSTSYSLGIQALLDGENLGAICTLYHSPDGNTFRWNTILFPDAYGIHFDNDVVLPTDILNIFLVMFDPFEQVYTGNVWYDIIDSVVEALKVPVFGYFSPWDILTTFIGLSIFLWLLKALAGG